MSENLRKLRIQQRISMGVVAAIAAGSMSGSVDARPLPRELSICYDNPTPEHPRPKVDTGDSGNLTTSQIDPIIVKQNTGEAAEGYAGSMSPDITSKVRGAAVKIQRGESSGSGVVVTGRDGSRVVVTAAHVALGESNDPVIVTDAEGRQATVVSGCYVNGTDGVASSAIDKNPDQIDFAILRTQVPLGSTALSFANQPPKRGDLVGFYNFQQNRSIDDAANYSGIALDVRSPYLDNAVLTSLGSEDDDKYDHAVVPGASGGPAVNYYTGDLYGLSVSMGIRTTEQMTQYGVVYESFVSSSADRTFVAGMVDATHIQRGLQEGRY